ncbi:MAG: hypothetical protein B7Y70_00835 [Rhizobiales bacterium 35-68-8]|nr:MAG: hypothetical protein B7Y70_00835 [Rhizobiales bacterium 35-68-8]
MLILDRLDRLDETLAGIAQRIEALEGRLDRLGEEKARRDHRDARMEERRTAFDRQRRFDMYED